MDTQREPESSAVPCAKEAEDTSKLEMGEDDSKDNQKKNRVKARREGSEVHKREFPQAGPAKERKERASRAMTGTGASSNAAGRPQESGGSLTPLPATKEDAVAAMRSQNEALEQPKPAGTGEAHSQDLLLQHQRTYTRLEKRFLKERRLSAQRKLRREGIPTGSLGDPWKEKKRRKPEGMSTTAFIKTNKKTIAEQIVAMDRRMFGRGQAPWDDPVASDSDYDSSDSDSSSADKVKRVKTPEAEKVIQAWRDRQAKRRRDTLTLQNQLHLLNEKAMTPFVSAASKRHLALAASRSQPKLPPEVRLSRAETFQRMDPLEKIMSLKSRSTLKLSKSSSALRPTLATRVSKPPGLSSPLPASSGQDSLSSSSAGPSERYERPETDPQGRPIRRRLTSSNFEIADLTGIAAPDAQVILNREENKEMYRQNLKRKLEAVNREGLNLEFREKRLAKQAAARELERERELERLQREIIDAAPDNYGLQHQIYSKMLEDHAEKDFLEKRLIDRGGYPEPQELMRRMNQPFEYEPRVPLGAIRAGQTEGNFEFENDEADPNCKKQKLDGATALSNEDPFQRDDHDPDRLLSTPDANAPTKVMGLNMMKAVRDFVRKRVGNTWGDYQVRYQYIQIMQLLDAQYELAAQRARQRLEQLNRVAQQALKEAFENLRNDHDKRMLQQMIEAQVQKEKAEFEQSLFWQQRLYDKLQTEMARTERLDDAQRELERQSTELEYRLKSEEPCTKTVHGQIKHEAKRQKELKKELRHLKKQAMLNAPTQQATVKLPSPKTMQKLSPVRRSRINDLSQPKGSERRGPDDTADDSVSFLLESEEVVREMTKAMQEDKRTLKQVQTLHAQACRNRQELRHMLELTIKDLDHSIVKAQSLIKAHKKDQKAAQALGSPLDQAEELTQMREYQKQQSQSEMSYLQSKLRMVTLLYKKAFPPKRDPAEEAVEALQKMPSDRRGQQLEIDITNPEIIQLISGQREFHEQQHFRQDVSNLGSYMGVPEISTILKASDASRVLEESKLSTTFEQEQSNMLDSLHEASVDFPDQIKAANVEADKMYRSKSAPRFTQVEPTTFKVSVLPSIDRATIIDIQNKSVSPLAQGRQQVLNGKSADKLARIKLIASRRKSLNRTQNLLSKSSTRQGSDGKSLLPSIASFSKGKLDTALNSTAKSAVKQAMALYRESKRSKQATLNDWKKDGLLSKASERTHYRVNESEVDPTVLESKYDNEKGEKVAQSATIKRISITHAILNKDNHHQ